MMETGFRLTVNASALLGIGHERQGTASSLDALLRCERAAPTIRGR